MYRGQKAQDHKNFEADTPMADNRRADYRRRARVDRTRDFYRGRAHFWCASLRTGHLPDENIRHYGLFAKSACADNIARARELLAVAKSEGQPAATTVDLNKPSCPCCGGRMIVIEVFERGATPRHRPTGPTNVIRIDTS